MSLCLGNKKVEIINKPTKYEEVIIPDKSFVKNVYYSDEYKKIYEHIINAALKESIDYTSFPSKIFLSRCKLHRINKKEFNLDVIDNWFLVNGFTIVYPEKFTIKQLIVLLQNADEIGTYSGSIQHNLIFSRKNAETFIIERFPLNVDYTVNINRIFDINTTHIDANYSIYPTTFWGPFMLCYNKIAERYTIDHDMKRPDEKLLKKQLSKSILKKYFKAYKMELGYQWFMYDWAENLIFSFRESYIDSMKEIGDYIKGYKPIYVRDIFSKRYFSRIQKVFKSKLSDLF